MTTTQTITTTDPADADLIESLSQSISATGDTYLSDSTGTEVPYILTEADVRNGSGRVIGTEYTVSGETYAFLVEAVRLSRGAESDDALEDDVRVRELERVADALGVSTAVLVHAAEEYRAGRFAVPLDQATIDMVERGRSH